MSPRFPILVFAVLLGLTACRTRSEGPPAVGEAFAGPATLNIRKDLPLQSPIVATARHGDRLEIIQTRRRFVQVRTAQGATGWTDGRLLLSTDQMRDLQKFTEATSTLPSQGTASVFEALNVHTEPSRTSPSFIQIPENGVVQVIGHRVTPRTSATPPAPPPLLAPVRKTRSKKAREKDGEKSRRTPPPPMPPAPKVPDNWQQLSHPTLQEALSREPVVETRPRGPDEPKPMILEDWSLVRTKDGKAGWVLSRMLTMSIPDEVAQYAEGQRITSYFSLADVKDEDQTKHIWLWTTLSRGGQPFEFDGFRVFVWSRKRHRYETVFRGREVKGFYPVSTQPGSGERGEGATFSLVVDEEGKLVRNTYVFNGYRVNLQRSDPYVPPQQEPEAARVQSAAPPRSPAPPTPADPLYKRLYDRVRGLFR